MRKHEYVKASSKEELEKEYPNNVGIVEVEKDGRESYYRVYFDKEEFELDKKIHEICTKGILLYSEYPTHSYTYFCSHEYYYLPETNEVVDILGWDHRDEIEHYTPEHFLSFCRSTSTREKLEKILKEREEFEKI